MIKLIVTDVDDTVVPESTDALNPEYFDVIRECLKKGIHFGVASGRQRASIQRVFAPVRDEIFFIGDNGTDIVSGDYAVTMQIEETLYQELIRDLKSLGPQYQVMACKPGMAYTDRGSEELYHLMKDQYHYHVEMVERLEDLQGISKVSAWRDKGVEKEVSQALTGRWADKLEAYMAGLCFYDFMGKGNHKGKALAVMQEHFGVKPEETVVFGNADNDIPMIQQATYGYAVSNGSGRLKETAYGVIGEMKQDAVLQKIKDLIRE